jgi:hypothetical protein
MFNGYKVDKLFVGSLALGAASSALEAWADHTLAKNAAKRAARKAMMEAGDDLPADDSEQGSLPEDCAPMLDNLRKGHHEPACDNEFDEMMATMFNGKKRL